MLVRIGLVLSFPLAIGGTVGLFAAAYGGDVPPATFVTVLGGDLVVAATAVGFARERTWSRVAAVCFWPVAIAAGAAQFSDGLVSRFDFLHSSINATVAWAIAAWYLFRKFNVVAYYDELGRLST